MNDKRVAHLLEQLRERTPEEATLGVMAPGSLLHTRDVARSRLASDGAE